MEHSPIPPPDEIEHEEEEGRGGRTEESRGRGGLERTGRGRCGRGGGHQVEVTG